MRAPKIIPTACAFLSLLICNASAFCLYSCTPTEDNAKAAFENLVKSSLGGAQFEIVRFKKTNGVLAELAGLKMYELSYEAEIILPNGAHPECGPQQKDGSVWDSLSKLQKCAEPNIRYWPPGQKLIYSEKYAFIQNEKGWIGPDGQLY